MKEYISEIQKAIEASLEKQEKWMLKTLEFKEKFKKVKTTTEYSKLLKKYEKEILPILYNYLNLTTGHLK